MGGPAVERGARDARWAGVLVVGNGVAVYRGPGSSAARHRHDAVQMVWSLDDPFVLRLEHRDLRARVAVVPARGEHALEAARSRLILLLVEPTGPTGAALDRFAAAHVGVDLAELFADVPAPPPGSAEELMAWGRRLIDRAAGAVPPARGAGPRSEVLAAARHVTTHLEGVPRLAEVAALVALSPRQLSRSFTREIGMPFRRYIVWSRLRRALFAVRDGADLTTASAAAGFADSAHFSRVFRAVFGLVPSEILPLLEVVEVDPAQR